ncbi:sulfotransferase [Salinibacter ruber]
MLRNPVDRTYSHYWHRVKTGRAVHGFEYELQHGPSTLLLRSFYKPQLERYFDFFPEDQVKVILLERFVDHTQAVVDEVCSFLGLETAVDVAGVDAHQNRSPMPRWPGLQLLLNYCTTGIETRSEGELPYPAQPQSSYALQGLVHHLRQLNLTPRRPPQFRSSSKAGMLTSPHNKRGPSRKDQEIRGRSDGAKRVCSGGKQKQDHASGELPGECRTRSALGTQCPSSAWAARDPRSRSAGSGATEYSPGWP